MTVYANEFERMTDSIPDVRKRQAVLDVMDSAYLVKLWFRAQKITATAADIVAMTAQIMSRMPTQSDASW
jgi:hypothetical protein